MTYKSASRAAVLASAIVVMIVTSAAPQEPATGDWTASTKVLAAEKERAKTCVEIVKQFAADRPGVIARARLVYSDAKAETDSAISALQAALVSGETVAFLEIETVLTEATALREQLCTKAVALIPDTEGQRLVGLDVLAKALSSLIEAAKDIYLSYRDEQLRRREALALQLDAYRWLDFNQI